VKPYRETTPIFAKFGVEAQLDAMFSSQVTLKSGGYIVINQTEALVAIDVNSGRSTREHNIEDTAVRTNLEAADEVARQLRLRDLAGLIVIDFIDMEENRNNRSVERRLKDALKNDRARIQVGRISPFGLMEMSRQRIRTGVLEGSTVVCPHCVGSGMVRATPSVALHVLRSVEELLLKSATHHVTVKARGDIALYVLNQKRMHLRSLEETFLVNITVLADDSLTGTHPFSVERGEVVMPGDVQIARPVNPAGFIPVEEPEIDEVDEEIEEEEEIIDQDSSGEQDGEGRESRSNGSNADSEGGEAGRRRRRRRRRRGGQNGERPIDGSAPMPLDAPQPVVSGAPFTGTHVIGEDGEIVTEREVTDKPIGEGEAARRRRGRRGGRRNGRRDRPEGELALAGGEASDDVSNETHQPELAVSLSGAGDTEIPETVKKVRAPRKPRAPAANVTSEVSAPVVTEPVVVSAPEPVAARLPESITTEPVVIADPNKPKKGGWWAKAKATLSGE
jgi:ribonuclease E